jgi:hypothetical protein
MKTGIWWSGLAVLVLTACVPREMQQPSWDGLQYVERRGLDTLYLRPGVSLKQYQKVMLDPVEVSFHKDWDPRRQGPTRLESADPQAIRKGLAQLAHEVVEKELAAGGYPLVTEPGPDVLRVRAEIVDLYINAPETNSATPTRTYVLDAGEMTLVAQLYDSETNALLARAVDRARGQDIGRFQIANRVTNTAEARRVLTKWARMLRDALDRAKAEE